MPSSSNPQRERQLRATAQRQGFVLHKSRERNPQASSFGTYMVTKPQVSDAVLRSTPDGYGLNLDDVEEILAEHRAERPITVVTQVEDEGALVFDDLCTPILVWRENYRYGRERHDGWVLLVVEEDDYFVGYGFDKRDQALAAARAHLASSAFSSAVERCTEGASS